MSEAKENRRRAREIMLQKENKQILEIENKIKEATENGRTKIWVSPLSNTMQTYFEDKGYFHYRDYNPQKFWPTIVSFLTW